MTPYVALLRAVNVGGTGALPMTRLKALGADAGLANPRTYIASGNLLFESDLTEPALIDRIEAALAQALDKRIEVFVRSLDELEAIIAANPFPDAVGSRHMVFFHAAPLPHDFGDRCRDRRDERLSVNGRELHVDYGEGIRTTKLKIPDKHSRTARNMNTVRKLAALLRA
ncbi:uncharacterized protein (DUF1697 family) [Novosphingobium kunmingense]|uniref:Uncharacterized protein (DUF1697 family) n=1 Tax=Novosphingobium kunmingense TaxID=1211806 RepID=A0A2N0I3Q1_9SPHN|nr:DUF1697 domain-containing protein [Novosphingobium kunmingense]PKB25800.1 uncharacterized protein (DUF1697 family) [Novosphingobium kunmingense]